VGINLSPSFSVHVFCSSDYCMYGPAISLYVTGEDVCSAQISFYAQKTVECENE
jgi:hypothetical protein